jgi:hypothetical protein
MLMFKYLFCSSWGKLVRLALFFSLMMHFNVVDAQKRIRTEGTYSMELSRTATMEATESQCIEQARLAAIAREFGTTVSETIINRVNDNAGQVDNAFHALTRTSVRGEWLEDEDKPQVTWSCVSDRLQVMAVVKGVIREIPKTGVVDVVFYTCSPHDITRPVNEFRNGESMNAFFQSSSSGYLSVFYVDHSLQIVQRLFPSLNREADDAVEVAANREYTLFNRLSAVDYGWSALSKELDLSLPLEKNEALDEIVMVYTKELYVKPLLKDSPDGFSELSLQDFENWISEVKSNQRNSVVKNIQLTIVH